jgi:flavin-dependent dehydrogenase
MPEAVDVAIVGGGPAGAALATHLAQVGVSTLLFERQREPEWRACGVFSSPRTLKRLGDLGIPADEVAALARPISALQLETVGGAKCRIQYEHGHANGFDRVNLDRALLERARVAGAAVHMATVARSVTLPARRGEHASLEVSPTLVADKGERRTIRARVVVGADGTGSIVARAGALGGRSRLRKSGLTYQREDPAAAPARVPMEGRFVFGRGWYAGIAPVPGGRVNVGVVVPGGWLSAGPHVIEARLLGHFPGSREQWMDGPITDGYRVAGTLEHRPERVAADGCLLVGDAAGFIDPLSGEGLHRALVSAEMAAAAIQLWLAGDRQALDDYDRHLRARFLAKDVVSWVLQLFIGQPALLDYALDRLSRRQRQRRTLTLVLTDQQRASRAVDPRFLLGLLAP